MEFVDWECSSICPEIVDVVVPFVRDMKFTGKQINHFYELITPDKIFTGKEKAFNHCDVLHV